MTTTPVAQFAAAVQASDYRGAVQVLRACDEDTAVRVFSALMEAAGSNGQVQVTQVVGEVPAGASVVGFKIGR